MEYNVLIFESKNYDDLKELEEFIKDAEIIISNYGLAWKKSYIKNIINSFHGPAIEFIDGDITYGHDIYSKLVINTKKNQKNDNFS